MGWGNLKVNSGLQQALNNTCRSIRASYVVVKIDGTLVALAALSWRTLVALVVQKTVSPQ